jgi:hypothetical protein
MARSTWTERDIPDLAGRRAIVTGASSGIGLEASRLLAAAGAEVVLAVRRDPSPCSRECTTQTPVPLTPSPTSKSASGASSGAGRPPRNRQRRNQRLPRIPRAFLKVRGFAS